MKLAIQSEAPNFAKSLSKDIHFIGIGINVLDINYKTRLIENKRFI